MPDIYLKRLHGAEYTKLEEPVPAETTGRVPDEAQRRVRRSSGSLCSPKLVVNLFRHELHPPAVGGNGQIGYLSVQDCAALH